MSKQRPKAWCPVGKVAREGYLSGRAGRAGGRTLPSGSDAKYGRSSIGTCNRRPPSREKYPVCVVIGRV